MAGWEEGENTWDGWMREMLGREATSALSLSHLPTVAQLPSRVGGDGRCGSSGGEGTTRCGAATKWRGGLRKKLRFSFFFLFLVSITNLACLSLSL